MGNKKKVLLTGITGQDGSHLADLLLEKGYEVHGIIRRSSSFNTGRINHIFDKLNLHYGDMTDGLSMDRLVKEIMPDEVYNLAAQSHVAVSFEIPEYTANVDGVGTLRLFESVRNHCPNAKIYNATTSELFGKVQEVPQKETTPFYPRSPYGVAKLYSYWIAKNYKESYGMFISNGILFNHSGERRGDTFVLKKIVNRLKTIEKTPSLNIEPVSEENILELGNLDAKRDIGYAKDYVYGMWLMLQQDKPDDYVLATNKTYSIREMVEMVWNELGREMKWEGEGINEKGYDKESGNLIVKVNEKYFRPCEVDLLIGDYSKAKKELGWEPKHDLKAIISNMVHGPLDTNTFK